MEKIALAVQRALHNETPGQARIGVVQGAVAAPAHPEPRTGRITYIRTPTVAIAPRVLERHRVTSVNARHDGRRFPIAAHADPDADAQERLADARRDQSEQGRRQIHHRAQPRHQLRDGGRTTRRCWWTPTCAILTCATCWSSSRDRASSTTSWARRALEDLLIHPDIGQSRRASRRRAGREDAPS